MSCFACSSPNKKVGVARDKQEEREVKGKGEETGRGARLSGLVGHHKKCGFYSECAGKPLEVLSRGWHDLIYFVKKIVRCGEQI